MQHANVGALFTDQYTDVNASAMTSHTTCSAGKRRLRMLVLGFTRFHVHIRQAHCRFSNCTGMR